jgi:F-type H+-transporting ATPase subunit b
MIRKTFSRLIVLLLIPVSSLLAEEHLAEETGHVAESPGIFSGDLFTSLFTIALFVLILVVLGKWAWGPILSGLQKREEHIRQSIEEAENARGEADKVLQDYKDQLAKAHKESQEILAKGRVDAIQLAEQFKQQAHKEAQALRQQAHRDIQSAKETALKDIYQQSTVIATDLAGRIIEKSLSPDDHQHLLQESLNKLQSGSFD